MIAPVRILSGTRVVDMAVREGVAYQAPSSFSSVSEYGYAILDTPGRLCDRALAVSTLTEEMTEV